MTGFDSHGNSYLHFTLCDIKSDTIYKIQRFERNYFSTKKNRPTRIDMPANFIKMLTTNVESLQVQLGRQKIIHHNEIPSLVHGLKQEQKSLTGENP